MSRVADDRRKIASKLFQFRFVPSGVHPVLSGIDVVARNRCGTLSGPSGTFAAPPSTRCVDRLVTLLLSEVLHVFPPAVSVS
jgi:hypothetical protein